MRRAWRQFAALRFNEQDVYIEVFSGFGFAPGFGFKDLRIYLDGALVGRAWTVGCSLGFGGRGGPAVAILRDGRALRIDLQRGVDEQPEVLELLGLADRLVLPLRIDLDSFIVTHTGIVLDGNSKFLVEYDTIEEAEVFVAKANGMDVAALRLEMQEYARMRGEYHRRLMQSRKRDAT